MRKPRKYLIPSLITTVLIAALIAIVANVVSSATQNYAWVLTHPVPRYHHLSRASSTFIETRLSAAYALLYAPDPCPEPRNAIIEQQIIIIAEQREEILSYFALVHDSLAADTLVSRESYHLKRSALITMEAYALIYIDNYIPLFLECVLDGNIECAIYYKHRARYFANRFFDLYDETTTLILQTISHRIGVAERSARLAFNAPLVAGIAVLVLTVVLGSLFYKSLAKDVHEIEAVANPCRPYPINTTRKES